MTANYTEEETKQLVVLYQKYGNEGLAEIAEQLGKTVPSVRAKLVNMDEYIRVGKKSTRKRTSKKELVASIEEAVGFDCTGLLPSNRDTLEELLEFLSN